MKKLIMLAVALLIAQPVLAATGTSSATITLYKAYLSANGNCSSPTVFLEDANGVAVDFDSTNNTIGTGTIADGTYKCVIFKMSDQVSFVPDADEGSSCVAGITYTMDVCAPRQSQDGSTFTPTVTNPENNSTADCTDGTDTLWVYISTFSTTTSGDESSNSFAPPTADGDATNGFKLNNEITISADLTGTFVFGTDGKVETLNHGEQGADQCDMQPPDFSFTTS